MIIAALLNFHHRASMTFVAADGQRLVGGVVDAFHRHHLDIFRNSLFQQLHDSSPILGAEDQPCARLPKLLAHSLGQTACNDHIRLRITTAAAPDELQTLFIAGARNGTGVDQINIRGRPVRHDTVAVPLKSLQHGLGVVLIYLAAQRNSCDGFHHDRFPSLHWFTFRPWPSRERQGRKAPPSPCGGFAGPALRFARPAWQSAAVPLRRCRPPGRSRSAPA